MRRVVFVVPGRLETLTGGYGYDRRIVTGLRESGWAVDLRQLDESFPAPTKAAQAHAASEFATLPSGALVVVDGLAMGAMPQIAEAEASRLRLIALVHHPLAEETGLEPATAARFEASERRALATAALVVVTSRATASKIGAYGVPAERVRVVEPGTDPAPVARGSTGRPLELLCVATLTPRKGHTLLFDALATIPDRLWSLTCVGGLARDPATTEQLRRRLVQLGLQDRVELRDEVEAPELAEYYDRADLFVLATFYEGYGMAVAEALARGLPVVSTCTGAIPDLVGDEAGLVVPPGDRDALAAALSRVILDHDLRRRFAEGARRVRLRLGSWNDAATKMARALDEALVGA